MWIESNKMISRRTHLAVIPALLAAVIASFPSCAAWPQADIPCQKVAAAAFGGPISQSSSNCHRRRNARTSLYSSLTENIIPAPPPLKALPLPVLLAGGLFLFGTSVESKHKQFASELLDQSQTVLRSDPAVSMELGQDLESGGVFVSSFASVESNGQTLDQLVLQFQINGGNAWAQGVAYGIRQENNEVRLVTLEVANMDAMLFGTSSSVAVPNEPVVREDEKAEL